MGRACFVCLDSDGGAVALGCACRGESAYAHVGCMVSAATHGCDKAKWSTCGTCTEDFTGEMQMGLAFAHYKHSVEQGLFDVDPETGASRLNLSEVISAVRDMGHASARQGQFPRAERLARWTHSVFARHVGAESADALQAMGNVAAVVLAQGMYAQADAIYADLLPTMRRVLCADHPFTLCVEISVVQWHVAQRLGCEGLARAVVAKCARHYGAEHPRTLSSMSALGEALMVAGKGAESEAAHTEVAETSRRVLGANHPDTMYARMNIAWAKHKQRMGTGAHAQRVLCAAAAHLFGAESAAAVDGQCILVRMLWDYDRPAAAVILERILPVYARLYGAAHPNTAQYEGMLRASRTFGFGIG